MMASIYIFIPIFIIYAMIFQIESPNPGNLTPQLSPLHNNVGTDMIMTPLMLGSEPNNDHSLNELDLEDFELESTQKVKTLRKSRTSHSSSNGFGYRPRLNSTWYVVENELEKIIEENNLEVSDDEVSEYDYDEESYQSIPKQDCYKNEPENQSVTNFQSQASSEPMGVQWQVPHPKQELLEKLQEIGRRSQINTDELKINAYRELIGSYTFEFERYYIEESFNQLIIESDRDIKKIKRMLVQGVTETFKKNIGGIPFQKRRIKLLKYLDKKKKRIWRKKVNYDCRKKVADGRVRVNGKFATIKQACEKFGIQRKQGEKSDKINHIFTKSF